MAKSEAIIACMPSWPKWEKDETQLTPLTMQECPLQAVLPATSCTAMPHAVPTGDADAYIRQVDHGDIIGAVTDSQRQNSQILFDQSNHRT